MVDVNLSAVNLTVNDFEDWPIVMFQTSLWIKMVFGGIAFIGNLFTLVVVLLIKEIRRKRSTYLIINLAIKDCTIGVSYVVLGKYALVGCTQHQFISYLIIWYVLVLSSSVLIIMIAIERCFAIIVPFKHRRYCTKNALTITIMLDWTVCLIVIVVLILCEDVFFDQILRNLNLVFMSIILCVSILTTVLYLVILLVVRHHATLIYQTGNASHKNKTQQNVNMIITFTFIAGILVMCYLPNAILHLMASTEIMLNYNSHIVVMKAIWILEPLIPFNSAVNIFIYWWRISGFRMAYRRVLCNQKHTFLQTMSTVRGSRKK